VHDTLLLFGATGDLAARQLFPALLHLLRDRLLPADFHIVGVARHAYDDAAFRAWLGERLSAAGEDGDGAAIADLLQPKLETRDTDPQNFASLVDRVAIHAGRPQVYATQMECVGGQSLAPRIAEPEGLDARRAAMGLEPYPAQFERRKQLCRKTQARATRQ